MTQTLTANTLTIEKNELSSLLRDVVREVVREELYRFAAGEGEWEIEENSVLWEDLTALRAESRSGTLTLLSYADSISKAAGVRTSGVTSVSFLSSALNAVKSQHVSIVSARV